MRALLVILTGLSLATAFGADAPPAGGPGKVTVAAAAAGAVTKAQSDDIRDVLLMLDESPLHLRFHLSLSGISLASARNAYAERLMKQLDTDGDGKLSPEEAARSPLSTARGKVTGGAYVKSLDGNRTKTHKDILDILQQVDQAAAAVVYRQDTSASNNDMEVFRFLDTDGSGYIDASEMAAAAAKILQRDLDQDECVTFQEFLPQPDPDEVAAQVVVARPGASERPVATKADLIFDVGQPLLPRAMFKKYDRNRDNKLTAAELGWEPERVKMLDRNSDGKLDERELSKVAETPVDLELAIDLAGAAEGEPVFTILATAGQRIDDARRPDLVRLAFAKTTLTLSFRKIDPIKAAVANAMQVFNRLDVDGNGYLDKQETSMGIRFERGLFDALDADGDGKIFGEEMEKYVKVRGEPAATQARVNLYDMGRGFFESLDANGDGRISMREMKSAGKALQKMARKDPSRLTPSDPVRNFHIEFLRGSFVLFGPTDQMIAQNAPPNFAERASVGPIWFQRMDRNNDGDLTWNEFLGPREAFHRIDTDGDGLIDAKEAFAVPDE
ncbi:MAG: EF-hand domain-containing protein [Planctomycetia bacterium]|nr:EF-hand domain-containing protein [Planctomycetia bacterium]